jgi:hypothetical protein
MHPDDTTTEPQRRGRVKLAAVLGAAALAIPGGAMIGNAFAADGGSSGSSTTQQQQPAADGATVPVQAQDDDPGRDGRDCPKDEGGSGSGEGGGSGSGTNPDTGTDTAPSGV